ncbi:hypothetical protein ACWDTP_00290 [Mycobacterium sp. NPDC003449]
MTAQTVATAGRGRTVVRDRARERLVEHAVLSVPGVVHRRGLLPGRALPAIGIVGDTSPIVDVEIAAGWPVDGATVLDDVRTAVTRELRTSLGQDPGRVDVRIARVDSDRTPIQVAEAYSAVAGDSDTVGTSPGATRHGPRRMAGATVTGVLVALALVVVGAIALRDVAIRAGWVDGGPWIAAAAGWADDAQWDWWTWPVAVAAALIGLTLLVVALKPRRRSYLPVGDGVWVPRGSVQRWRDSETDALESDGGGR